MSKQFRSDYNVTYAKSNVDISAIEDPATNSIDAHDSVRKAPGGGILLNKASINKKLPVKSSPNNFDFEGKEKWGPIPRELNRCEYYVSYAKSGRLIEQQIDKLILDGIIDKNDVDLLNTVS